MGHILLIEPDRILAAIYAKAISFSGWDVTHATDAQSALHLTDTVKPNAILLELNMAAHNGVEFLYEVRSYVDWQHIPIIVISHVPFAELGVNEVVWEQLGVVEYHYKPQLTLERLTESLHRLNVAATA